MNFLNTLPLSDDERTKMRDQDLTTAAAVVALSAAEIAAATGFKIGKAGAILSAARDVQEAAQQARRDADAADRDYERKKSQITLALQALRADSAPHRRKAVTDLGVLFVVLDDGDKVDAAASMALLRDLEDGAPVPQAWQGKRVVKVADLGAPTVFCDPRTRAALQGGVAKTGVPWGELGLDLLRLAAYGFREDLVHGMTDKAVFEGIRDDVDGLRTRLQQLAKSTQVDLASMDAVVVYKTHKLVDEPAHGERQPSSTPPSTGTVHTRFTKLLLASFSDSEIRRLVRYLPDGEELSRGLPGDTASPMAVADAATGILVRAAEELSAEARRLILAEKTDEARELYARAARTVDEISRSFSAKRNRLYPRPEEIAKAFASSGSTSTPILAAASTHHDNRMRSGAKIRRK